MNLHGLNHFHVCHYCWDFITIVFYHSFSLGLGDSSDQAEPQMLEYFQDMLGDAHIKKVRRIDSAVGEGHIPILIR